MSAELLLHIRHQLTEALRPVKLLGQSDSGDVERAVQVFIGDMPAKPDQQAPSNEKDSERNLPYVVIVPIAGHQEDGEAVEKVALICAAYNPQNRDTEAAETDLALILSTVARTFIPCSNGLPLAQRFVLATDTRKRLLPWVKSETQTRPFLQATITSVWRYHGWE